MKKFRIVMIAAMSVILVFGLAACSGGKASDSDSKTVEMQTDKDEAKYTKDMRQTIKDDTGLTLKYVTTTDVSAYQTNIQQSLSTSSAPALFSWWSGTQMEELVKNDLVVDLTDEWEKYYIPSGVNPDIADSMTIDGKIYGAPMNVIYNGIIYNKEIFDKYGLEEPKTFDDFLNICDTLVKKGVTPIGVGSTWQSFCWPQALMGSMDPELYDELTEGKVKFTDDRVKTIFYELIDMIQKGYFSDQEEDQGKDLANGKVAMEFNATNVLEGFSDFDMKPGEDIGMFVLPTATTDQKPTIFYEVAPILVGKNSTQVADAKKILRSYYSEDAQQEYADASGMSATTTTTFKNPLSQYMNECANDPDDYNLKLRYYEQFDPEVVNFSIDEYWKIFANPTKKQVDESLAAIQKELEKVEAE
ncbi:ABC transporter substrate-binding protein [Listeria costaricensis]|uniref:ABC transporter substrate-binding protein n=1 Tax=Listeria costaricensis TaxID=2026604 RepID=UPI000C080586|nr:extracellular solute-binding protein [Listeria costaricensis]